MTVYAFLGAVSRLRTNTTCGIRCYQVFRQRCHSRFPGRADQDCDRFQGLPSSYPTARPRFQFEDAEDEQAIRARNHRRRARGSQLSYAAASEPAHWEWVDSNTSPTAWPVSRLGLSASKRLSSHLQADHYGVFGAAASQAMMHTAGAGCRRSFLYLETIYTDMSSAVLSIQPSGACPARLSTVPPSSLQAGSTSTKPLHTQPFSYRTDQPGTARCCNREQPDRASHYIPKAQVQMRFINPSQRDCCTPAAHHG